MAGLLVSVSTNYGRLIFLSWRLWETASSAPQVAQRLQPGKRLKISNNSRCRCSESFPYKKPVPRSVIRNRWSGVLEERHHSPQHTEGLQSEHCWRLSQCWRRVRARNQPEPRQVSLAAWHAWLSPNVFTFSPGATSRELIEQAARLIKLLSGDKDRWKLVTILMGHNDVCTHPCNTTYTAFDASPR